MELGCDTWLIKSWTWTLETMAAPEQTRWDDKAHVIKDPLKTWRYT